MRSPVSNFSGRCPSRTLAELTRIPFGYATFFLILLVGCGSSPAVVFPEPTVPAPKIESLEVIGKDVVSPGQIVNTSGEPSLIQVITLQNQGGEMEGHTPRGFRGMGTGLFAGDNLNSRFPNGDGVQLFLTFDLSTVPSGKVVSATLSSENGSVRGMPLKDLGPLLAEEVRYQEFSSDLWNLEPFAGGDACEFATSSEGPFQCDVSGAVQKSLEDSFPYVQFRLRLDRAGDRDGSQDLVAFFIADSNTNQPGIFELEVAVEADN